MLNIERKIDLSGIRVMGKPVSPQVIRLKPQDHRVHRTSTVDLDPILA